jgi:hypothetical protein
MKKGAVENFKSVQTVAQENGCIEKKKKKWCADNGVPFIGSGQRKQYLIYPEHEECFKNREKPGRRWPAKKSKTKK